MILFFKARKLKKHVQGALHEALEGHEGGINCVAMSIDESILITGSEDCTARVWAVANDEIPEKCFGILE